MNMTQVDTKDRLQRPVSVTKSSEKQRIATKRRTSRDVGTLQNYVELPLVALMMLQVFQATVETALQHKK